MTLHSFEPEIKDDTNKTSDFDGLTWEENIEFEELEIDLDIALQVFLLIYRTLHEVCLIAHSHIPVILMENMKELSIGLMLCYFYYRLIL